jgi:acetyltransferase-like isoleucine patch superfamily enzyme
MREKIKFLFSINWLKTVYFNFKMFPFSIAKKLPVYFYGFVSYRNLSGKILIDAPIKSGMIGFGQSYETFNTSNKTAQISLEGKIIFKGHIQFGKDYLVSVKKGATLQMGHMSSLGSRGKIICCEKITLGDFARIGYESQLLDTTAHHMINTITNERYELTSQILIGNYNYVSNRVTILSKTKTPNYCNIASNTLCAKDYTIYGENILMGGIPANLIKENISRDWEREKDDLLKSLIL